MGIRKKKAAAEPPAEGVILADNITLMEKPVISKIIYSDRMEAGGDANVHPWSFRRGEGGNNPTGIEGQLGAISDNIGKLTPQRMMINRRDELYRASLTSWGAYPIYHGPKNAYRAGWRYMRRGKRFAPIPAELESYLDKLYFMYNIRENVILATQTCKLWTRCLFWPRQVAARGQPIKYEVHIIPIFEEHIRYDPTRTYITEYRPIVVLGDMPREVVIPANEAVLWRNGSDIFGSQYDGQATLIPMYKTVVRAENITDAVTGMIQRRGNGYLVVQVKGADATRIAEYKAAYSDPSQYAVFFVNDSVDVKAVPAMAQGFDMSKIMDALSHDLSRSSAFPSQRMEGQNEGKLAGAETIQDAQAEAYSVIQEDFERYILESYYLLDRLTENRGIENEDFQIDFETEVRMDPQRRANILATIGQALGNVKNLVKVNQALFMLHLPLLGEEDGDKFLIEWEKEFQPDPMELAAKGLQPNGLPLNNGPPLNKEGEPQKPPQDPAAYQEREANKEKEITKDSLVKALTCAGASYKQINTAVSELFGAGVSNTKIASLRNGDHG